MLTQFLLAANYLSYLFFALVVDFLEMGLDLVDVLFGGFGSSKLYGKIPVVIGSFIIRDVLYQVIQVNYRYKIRIFSDFAMNECVSLPIIPKKFLKAFQKILKYST